MPFCVAEGCHNQDSNNKEVSFHTFPKDQSRKQAWYDAIGRETLPLSGRVCSQHFTEDSYEDAGRLKLELCPDMFRDIKKTRRKLKPTAIPTLFSHKTPSTPRTSSVNRSHRDEVELSKTTTLFPGLECEFNIGCRGCPL